MRTVKLGIFLMISAAAVLAGACEKEFEERSVSGITSNKPVTQVETGTETRPTAAFVPGEAVVVLSDWLVEKVEQATGSGLEISSMDELSGIYSELGIKRMERLFPYAGEFEERTRKMGLHKFYRVDLGGPRTTEAQKAASEAPARVDSFEAQRRVTNLVTVNDPGFSQLWGLNSTKNTRSNINVEPVWEYTMGDPNVIVNVVDTGIDMNHEDLSWNCSTKDNYNFVSNKSTITAGDHGTHVAGTIAGVGNNGKGVIGIAGGDYAAGKRGVTLLSSEVFEGKNSARSFANAIVWGADHGAVISQNSWGDNFDYNDDGKLTGQELEDALAATIDSATKNAVDYFIRYAGCDKNGNQAAGSPMKGGVVIFAAGNDGIENGAPANYAPIFAVGAVKKSAALDYYSNYGSWVDICAPGTDIYSTVPNSKYDTYSGTSMACPHVSGAAALLLSFFQRDGFTNDDLLEMLLEGANRTKINYNGKACGPYLDVYSSFQYGLAKYKRENNNDPIIETEYTGDYTFRHWEDITIPFHIYDPDGDKVEVSAEFEDRGSLTQNASLSDIYDFSLLCQLVSDDAPKKVKITASDMYEGVAEMEFSYKVLPNNPPVMDGKLKDLLYTLEDKPKAIDLNGIFSDPDGEDLRLSVLSSPVGIIRTRLDEDNTISINISGPGLATVYVSASDHMGAKVESQFRVLVRSTDSEMDIYPNPVIDILHIRTGLEKEDLPVTVLNSTGATTFSGILSCSAFEPGEIDMSSYAPGQYKVVVEKNGEKTARTIIKR
ncbi:MAG: S8 family serine peptidase [Bacteroidales bacterium]|nr:S8 family serine peptidase [Bacteroidales bacterium]